MSEQSIEQLIREIARAEALAVVSELQARPAAALYQDLMEHKARQAKERIGWRRDHDLVFAATNGEPLHRANLSARVLKPILQQAELPTEFTLYTLRRSFSSLLRRAGVSAKEVAEQMGHIRPDFTDEVYVAVYDSAKREMVERLESALLPDACALPAHNEDGPPT